MYAINVIRYTGLPLPDLDERGRRIYFRACDLSARMWIQDNVLSEYDAGNLEGACMLLHAEVYLADRLAYELATWPKGMFKLETAEDYRLP